MSLCFILGFECFILVRLDRILARSTAIVDDLLGKRIFKIQVTNEDCYFLFVLRR